MATSPGTFEIVALEFAKALEPIANRMRDEHAMALLAELGLELPHHGMTPALEKAFHDAVISAEALPQAAQELITAIDGGDTLEILGKAVVVIEQVLLVIASFKTIADEISAIGPIPGLTPEELAAFVADLPKRLTETMIIVYLENEHELILAQLELFGLAEQTHVNPGSTDPLHPDHIRKVLRLDRLEKLLTSPEDLVKDLYKWGLPTFDGGLLINRLTNLLESLDIVVTRKELPGTPPLPALEVGLVTIAPTQSLVPPGLDATLMLDVGEGATFELPISEGLAALLSATGAMDASVGIRIQPPVTVTLIPPSGSVQGQVTAALAATAVPPEEQILLLGIMGGTSLSVRRMSGGLISGFRWNSSTGKAEGDFGIEGHFEGGKLHIGMDGADGFLGGLLSGVSLDAEFDLGFGWTAGGGIYFTGSGVLEILLPAHISLGPINIDGLTLTVGMQGGIFPIGLAANISALLGPLAAAVEQVGAEVRLSFPGDHSGNLGIMNVGFAFKPPKGVGLAIDAGVVKGGGYLFFDFDKGEYAGILELDLSGIISVKAIGLITTKMPDGSPGFSLLLIITAEFGTPIQLGFGFTLSGVGGLLGLNRTMRLEVIATGIRDGGINSIMFPQDVVANAPRIISDLKKYFPVEDGTFLIGPMVKIGWGTPNLVTVSMGIIIEIPGNIAILGVLKVVLPDEAAPLIVIQVNFMGAIEFDKSRLWFFAAIFESRILYITLDGEMGLLVGWGDEPAFVVSVGGFHPAFNPPPLPFGAIARIAISILNTDFARIRVGAYFAVTSNSVQFGAAAELFFGLSAFKIEGHLAFDALFRFSPFYFIITISASLGVKVFGVGLFSVRMRGSLEGPTPWHVEGTGSISLLFFDIDVDFSHTWGNEEETTLPPIAVAPLLVNEFQKLENWLAVLPASNKLLVSIRNMAPGTTDLILHPVGGLKISQRAVPLGLTIDKVGNQKPSDANLFNIRVSGLAERGAVEESFAVGQFFAKSDDELLSAKSFEPLKGGVELSVAGEQYRAPKAVRRVIRYEKIILDTLFKRFVKKAFPWVGILFNLFANGSAVALSALSNKQQKQFKPFADKVQIGKTLYAVARHEDNTPFDDTAVGFTSQTQAQEYLKQQIATDANLAKQLHVIPQVEMQRTE